MKVKELISKLGEYDGELEVQLQDVECRECSDYTGINEVIKITDRFQNDKIIIQN